MNESADPKLKARVAGQSTNYMLMLMAGLVIALAGLLAYWNSLEGVFLFDDLRVIVDNPSIRNLFPISSHLTGMRPITMLTFAINYHFSGLELAAFHWTNIIIHLLAGVVLYLLVYQTFLSESFTESVRELAGKIAFATGLIWIVHPLNTQAVTYVVQRGESLMGLSFLLFLLLYARSASSARSWIWLLAAWFIFCIGLGCKQVMVMALPVVLLYDRAFLAESWKDAIARRGWLWAICVAPLIAAVIYFLPAISGGEGGAGFQLAAVSPTQYLATQPEVILHYLRLVIWPFPQVLDYGWPIETDTTQITWTSLVVGGMILSLAVTYFIWSSARAWAFWGLAFFLVLVPTSSILPLQDLAVEHRMYVPLAMVIVVMVATLVVWIEKLASNQSQLLFVALTGLLAIGCGYATHLRNQDYHSATSMWQDVIAKTVDRGQENIFAGRTYNNLGQAYADLGEWQTSIDWLNKALETTNFPKEVHGNLARAYLAINDLDKAKLNIIAAMSLEPESPKIMQQAGLVAAATKDHAQAEFHFRAAANMNPSDILIQMNLAQSLLAQKKFDAAKTVFEKVIEKDPKYVEAKRRLLKLLLRKNAVNDAKAVLDEYASQLPDDLWVNFYRGEIFLREKNLDQAIEQWEKSLEADPPPPEVFFLLGNGYRIKGDAKKAMTFYENAIRNDPNHVEALNNLGGLLARNNPRQAIGYFERVVKLAPRFLQARYNIASLQLQMNKVEEAKEQLNAILKVKPDFKPAIDLLKSLDSSAVSN